ncbi:MAG: galactose-1-phosphate uridylyltransferase [Firmicutes bacterium]|jgi:UDPglucose--hexose-1-phosphate uridylyltransferase|nr:galactose-1-phosphate uridylyltransferase [Bacillota bacterium]
MPEFRRDIVTGKWVIVATERAKRPDKFTEPEKPQKERIKPNCPFCVGNERETPPEVQSVREPSTEPNTPGWRVRTVPNKFPALTPDGNAFEGEVGLYQTMSGVGVHEVIIESPAHDLSPGQLIVDEFEDVLVSYRKRYRALAEDPRLKYVLIFRNHGKQAGASLEHPHSQLIATPILPPVVAEELEGARCYFENTGRCVYCDMIREELRAGTRIVFQNDGFLVFEPFASRTPFETWILPRRHTPSFGDISDGELRHLAEAMHLTLHRIFEALNDPAYNYIIHTAPLRESDGEASYTHWHVEIMPKLTIAAGFEIGTGIFINTATPEDTAMFLREA